MALARFLLRAAWPTLTRRPLPANGSRLPGVNWGEGTGARSAGRALNRREGEESRDGYRDSVRVTMGMRSDVAARLAVRHLLPLLPLNDWYGSDPPSEIADALAAISPLLDFGVGDAPVPDLARQAWAAARRGTLFRALLAQSEEAGVLRAMRDAGVPLIVLKGAVLAETVYPAFGLRPMGDLDLLVWPHDAPAARAALHAIGFEAVPRGPGNNVAGIDGRISGEESFVRERGARSLAVDLHTRLLSVDRYLASFGELSNGEFWARARPAIVAGEECLALAPEDQLLHCCVHASIHHPFSHLPSYFDAHLLVATTDGLDWYTLVERAAEARVRTAAYAALLTTRNLLGTPVPGRVLRTLAPPIWSRLLLERLCQPRRLLRPDGVGLTHPEQQVARLLQADSLLAVWAGLRASLALGSLGSAWRAAKRGGVLTLRAARATWNLTRTR